MVQDARMIKRNPPEIREGETPAFSFHYSIWNREGELNIRGCMCMYTPNA